MNREFWMGISNLECVILSKGQTLQLIMMSLWIVADWCGDREPEHRRRATCTRPGRRSAAMLRKVCGGLQDTARRSQRSRRLRLHKPRGALSPHKQAARGESELPECAPHLRQARRGTHSRWHRVRIDRHCVNPRAIERERDRTSSAPAGVQYPRQDARFELAAN